MRSRSRRPIPADAGTFVNGAFVSIFGSESGLPPQADALDPRSISARIISSSGMDVTFRDSDVPADQLISLSVGLSVGSDTYDQVDGLASRDGGGGVPMARKPSRFRWHRPGRLRRRRLPLGHESTGGSYNLTSASTATGPAMPPSMSTTSRLTPVLATAAVDARNQSRPPAGDHQEHAGHRCRHRRQSFSTTTKSTAPVPSQPADFNDRVPAPSTRPTTPSCATISGSPAPPPRPPATPTATATYGGRLRRLEDGFWQVAGGERHLGQPGRLEQSRRPKFRSRTGPSPIDNWAEGSPSSHDSRPRPA